MLRILTGLAIFFCCVQAQVNTGAVSGYVLDPSERAIANAQVTITAEAGAIRRSIATDGAGFYQVRELPPAVYSVAAEASGFNSRTQDGVRVAVNSRQRLDVQLAVAGSRQSVTVESHVSDVWAESSELGTVIGTREIVNLPLNRRDFLQLSLLAPGVMPPVEDSELSTRGSFSMHANGAREEFNNFLLDGVDNNDPDVNRYNLQPAVDAIQEFKMATNLYSAEYGRSAGGQVNIVTRSGSNDFHGFAYEYLRNRVLDARNYFEGEEQLKYIRNQYGAGTGGPLHKDKTFFFANFDGLRERRGFSRLAVVPTAEVRTGDLSSLSATVFDPFTRQPFPGNRIPANRINPIAPKVLDLFPLPNLSGTGANYLGQPFRVTTRTRRTFAWTIVLLRRISCCSATAGSYGIWWSRSPKARRISRDSAIP